MRFFHPDLDSLDPRLRATAIETVLTEYQEHERRRVDVTTSLQERLAAVEEVLRSGRYTAFDTDTRNDLREALGQLERGPLPSEGTLPEVSPFVGLPGQRRTRAEIERLSAELADAVLLRDHGHEVGRYRLMRAVWVKGPDGRERRAEVGEIVRMSLTAYRARSRYEWDTYEPLLEEVPTGTSANVVEEAAATS